MSIEVAENCRMEEKKVVVVAVDESEESMHALSWCLNNLIHHNPKTTLILLYIKPLLPVYGYLFSGDDLQTMEKYNRDLTDSVMNRADQLCRSTSNTTVKVEKKVGYGNPKDVICIAVDKLGADILVIGSHDYGFFKRALLGSVSDYIAKHVKCPLVVVKRPKTTYNN